ncbi:MAG: D-glycero-beta-D-manno-heptose-7-phosphate kinase [Dissulfurimicrobium sp.]|nr:D-glycero-beta-D-manno-heptose-7-phosphate kinase [Dissulfurimicrobium hydrothermale]UKL14124.1 D-glycero-beta-D-manno-heptose-7-phosphate kinase [Dissulfurimicrobium hydrothermale]
MTDRTRLLVAVEAFEQARILVIGDLMLDQFVWGEVFRISPEAPVPIIEVSGETITLGGAANVANNLRSMGAEVALGGVIGNDPMGGSIKDMAQGQGIDTSAVVKDGRPTTVKTRIIARGQQVVRVDKEQRAPIGAECIEPMLAAVHNLKDGISSIVVSDYAKGTVTDGLMRGLKDLAKERNIPILVDPKPKNRHLYRNVNLITPNKKEAEDLAGVKINDEATLKEAARTIRQRLETEAVLITMGPQGMALWQGDDGLFTIPTMAQEVFDVTGAGDTVIATLALGLASGLALEEAACLANIAAGIVVGKAGTAVLTREELKEKICQEA